MLGVTSIDIKEGKDLDYKTSNIFSKVDAGEAHFFELLKCNRVSNGKIAVFCYTTLNYDNNTLRESVKKRSFFLVRIFLYLATFHAVTILIIFVK